MPDWKPEIRKRLVAALLEPTREALKTIAAQLEREHPGTNRAGVWPSAR